MQKNVNNKNDLFCKGLSLKFKIVYHEWIRIENYYPFSTL